MNRVYNMRKLGWKCSALIAMLCGLLAPCAGSQESGLHPVTCVTQWKPQAQFAGFYMAKEKGFYKECGLDVSIIAGGSGRRPVDLLKEGKAQFACIFLSNAIRERAANGVPLVNIAQLSQESEQILVARKSSGIKGPEDLNGKRVSLWPDSRVRSLALFRKFNVTPEILPQSASINLFLRGGTDVATAMKYSEYHLLIESGMDEDELQIIDFAKYGLGFPEDGIYCLDTLVQNQRDVCRGFVQATIRGWQYALDHYGETLDVIMQYTKNDHTGSSRAHQRWMLNRMNDIIKPPHENAGTGMLMAEDYDLAVRELKAVGVIETAPPLESFYVPCME
jgi:NitT/TauT family transport system substrate-binding protein